MGSGRSSDVALNGSNPWYRTTCDATGDLHEPEAALRERQGPRTGTSPGQRAVPAQGAAGEAEPEGRGAHEPPARPFRRARHSAGACVRVACAHVRVYARACVWWW